jgi:cysteine desulfurase/selenocysteine lyase
MQNINAHEKSLHDYMVSELAKLDGIRLIGTPKNQASVQSFALNDIHPHDLGTLLDHQGVAVRTGHHCAMPVMQRFGLPGTTRASLGLYNSSDDIDRLIVALEKARTVFA